MTFIAQSQPTARKVHVCETCYAKIQPGEKYHRQADSIDGTVYTFKACMPCREMFDEVWRDFGGPYRDEGIGADDYAEWARDNAASHPWASAYLDRRLAAIR